MAYITFFILKTFLTSLFGLFAFKSIRYSDFIKNLLSNSGIKPLELININNHTIKLIKNK